MLTLEYAKDPQWNSDDGQQIFLIVKWEEFNEEMPFNSTTFDPEEYGRDLFERAKNGEFGEVAPYVAPIRPTFEPTPTTGTQTL